VTEKDTELSKAIDKLATWLRTVDTVRNWIKANYKTYYVPKLVAPDKKTACSAITISKY